MSIRNDPLWSRAVNLTLVQARINRRSVEALLEYYCAFRVSDLQTYQLSPYIHELEKLLSTTPRFKIGDRVKLPAEYGLGTVESVNVSYVVRRDSRTFCKNGSVWRESDCSEAPPEPTFEERRRLSGVHDDKPYAGLVARVTGPWLELRRAGVVRESEVHVHVQDEGAAAGPNNLAMHLEFCSRQYGGALCTCGWEPIE